jgi:hypothetical protein
VIGALRPEAVGRREIALHVTRVDRTDRGELMDDHVRLGSRHGVRDLVTIKRVRDHRHGAQLVEHRPLRLATRHAMNLMARANQTGHQLPSDRSRRACYEHSHRWLFDRGITYTP